MISNTDIHAWAPVILALQYPGIFYPVLIGLFFAAAGLWWWLHSPFIGNRRHPRARIRAQAVEDRFRKDLSLFFAGSVVVFGIIGTLIQFQANLEREHQQRRAALSAENTKLFDGAVQHLQSKSPISQLGAIFTFSQLIKQEGFYWTTVSELSAFLRDSLINRDTSKQDINRSEIHNAFYVLSERDRVSWTGRQSEPFPLDFSGLNLSGFKFSGLRFWGSDFQNNFSKAFLPGALFEGADLFCANLENAVFRMSSLFGPTEPSELGPKLGRVNFRNTDLGYVKFMKPVNAPTSWLNLDDACFEGAKLDGADISIFGSVLNKAAGLTREQIQTAKIRPAVPNDFQPRVCKEFKTLCPETSVSR
jgi:uncharacterized protein YjbI with pentapeptide repeats